QDVLRNTEIAVSETRSPGPENLLRMLHRNAHRVGNFTSILPKVDTAGRRDCPGDLKIERLVPESKLMAHVLVEIAARIIPEEAPVDVAVGVELTLRRFTEKRLPEDILRRHIRVRRS